MPECAHLLLASRACRVALRVYVGQSLQGIVSPVKELKLYKSVFGSYHGGNKSRDTLLPFIVSEGPNIHPPSVQRMSRFGVMGNRQIQIQRGERLPQNAGGQKALNRV